MDSYSCGVCNVVYQDISEFLSHKAECGNDTKVGHNATEETVFHVVEDASLPSETQSQQVTVLGQCTVMVNDNEVGQSSVVTGQGTQSSMAFNPSRDDKLILRTYQDLKGVHACRGKWQKFSEILCEQAQTNYWTPNKVRLRVKNLRDHYKRKKEKVKKVGARRVYIDPQLEEAFSCEYNIEQSKKENSISVTNSIDQPSTSRKRQVSSTGENYDITEAELSQAIQSVQEPSGSQSILREGLPMLKSDKVLLTKYIELITVPAPRGVWRKFAQEMNEELQTEFWTAEKCRLKIKNMKETFRQRKERALKGSTKRVYSDPLMEKAFAKELNAEWLWKAKHKQEFDQESDDGEGTKKARHVKKKARVEHQCCAGKVVEKIQDLLTQEQKAADRRHRETMERFDSFLTLMGKIVQQNALSSGCSQKLEILHRTEPERNSERTEQTS